MDRSRLDAIADQLLDGVAQGLDVVWGPLQPPSKRVRREDATPWTRLCDTLHNVLPLVTEPQPSDFFVALGGTSFAAERVINALFTGQGESGGRAGGRAGGRVARRVGGRAGGLAGGRVGGRAGGPHASTTDLDV